MKIASTLPRNNQKVLKSLYKLLQVCPFSCILHYKDLKALTTRTFKLCLANMGLPWLLKLCEAYRRRHGAGISLEIPAKIWGGEWKGKQGTRKKPREISLRAREQS